MSRMEFPCPECGQLLRAAVEIAGRKVRCGRCQGVVVVPAAAPPPPPKPPAPTVARPPNTTRPAARAAAPPPPPEPPDAEPDEQEDARPKKKKKKRRVKEWKWPRAGILLLLVGTALSLLFTATTYLVGWLITSLAALTTVSTLSFVLEMVYAVADLIGVVLCLFAPPAAGTRPVVGTAVACKVAAAVLFVVTFVALLPLWAQQDRAVKATELTRDGKLDEQRLNEMKAEMEQSVAELKRLLWLQQVLEIPATVIAGVTAAVIPLMLRGFCRALDLTDAEPLCDRLLQLGIGTFGFQLLVRLLAQALGIGALDVLTPLSYLAALLGFIWQVLYVILLVKIWRAMPRRR